ncbi:MAG: hypothetical protein M3393_07525 [Actinomycetota bacterium]|nr:hypothetical protein [Actinomycetota bacterium]
MQIRPMRRNLQQLSPHFDGKGQNGDGVFILDTVWEDDAHVLAVTYQQGRWMVVRLDTEGNMEQAADAVPGDDMSRPYFFSVRPGTAPMVADDGRHS